MPANDLQKSISFCENDDKGRRSRPIQNNFGGGFVISLRNRARISRKSPCAR